MKNDVSIVLIGIGGYGDNYLKLLLDSEDQTIANIVGVVDIKPEKSQNYNRIVERNIPIYYSIEEFYAQSSADLAIISTPIHFHTYQTCYALSHGSHVLCEKPMCASPEEAKQIIEARDRAGKFVAIGFNWSFSPSVQQFKKDIMNGVYGKPKRLKTLTLWPRNKAYYERSNWAGKIKDEKGNLILDSVASNATAHFLHHMFYILGLNKDQSTAIKQVTAELYRANPIESFDTCAIEVKTVEDIDIYFYASHAVTENIGPNFIYEFENAIISYSHNDTHRKVTATFNDGTKKVYTDPEEERPAKLWKCIQAVASGDYDIDCGPEAAYQHVLCIDSIHKSVPDIPTFSNELTHVDEETQLTWVDGLDRILTNCYDNWSLPSDQNISWSKRGKTIEVNNPIDVTNNG